MTWRRNVIQSPTYTSPSASTQSSMHCHRSWSTTASMNRQIPGYYYDEEKRKFFKIQPNHAVPAGSAYSADGVKRRKREDEAASALAKQTALMENQIRRASVFDDPFLGCSLSREYGHGSPLDAAVRTYTAGWNGQEILCSEFLAATYDLDMSRRPAISPVQSQLSNPLLHRMPLAVQSHNNSTVAMGGFDWDPVTRHLFCPFAGRSLYELVESSPNLRTGQRDETMQDDSHPLKPVFERGNGAMVSTNFAPITSINIDPTTGLMLTTWRAPRAQHNAHVVKVGRGESDFGVDSGPTVVWRILDGSGMPPTLWAATPGRPGSPFAFAIASEDGVIAINKDATRHSWIRPSLSPQYAYTEVVAVECLSQFPAVILAGQRNGSIMLLDVRTPQRQYHSGHNGIKNPSAVCNIKEIKDNLVVVAGLNSILCNYDLRFSKQQPLAKSWPDLCRSSAPGHVSQWPDSEFTNPVLIYPEHVNSAHMDLGFDIDTEAGIAAAVQDDEANTVKIFSLRSGMALRSLDAMRVGSSIDTADIKAMRFVSDGGNMGMKSLWVAKGTKMISYAW